MSNQIFSLWSDSNIVIESESIDVDNVELTIDDFGTREFDVINMTPHTKSRHLYVYYKHGHRNGELHQVEWPNGGVDEEILLTTDNKNEALEFAKKHFKLMNHQFYDYREFVREIYKDKTTGETVNIDN